MGKMYFCTGEYQKAINALSEVIDDEEYSSPSVLLCLAKSLVSEN